MRPSGVECDRGGEMAVVVALAVGLLFVGLVGLFVASARLIRRDMNDRFDRIRARLEEDACAIVQELVDGDGNAEAAKKT